MYDYHTVMRLTNKHIRTNVLMCWYVKICCIFYIYLQGVYISNIFQCLGVPVTLKLLSRVGFS